MQYTPLVSKFSFLCIILFFFLSLAFRLLLPYGDEPDFEYRINDLLDTSEKVYFPYGMLNNLVRSAISENVCVIESTPFSIWTSIDRASCTQNLTQILSRLLLVITIASPLFIFLLFRRFSYYSLGSGLQKSSVYKYNLRLDAVCLSLIFPGMIYSLGLLAREQLTLILSIFIFIFFGRILITLLMLTLILWIDIGNGIVVLFFILLMTLNNWIGKKFPLKVVFLLIVAQIMLAYFIGTSVLSTLTTMPFIGQKAELMNSTFSASDLIEKYPKILRPFVTYMSFIFLSPAYIKIPVLYVLVGIQLILMCIKCRRLYTVDSGMASKYKPTFKSNIIDAATCASTILIFVLFFPTYANAKYYIFMLPFILRLALDVYPRHSILLFNFLLSMTAIIFLLFYNLA